MGLTGHLAFAFDPQDEGRVIDVLNGQGREGDDALICSQPKFELVREDHREVHRLLEVLAETNSKFSPLSNSIVVGKRGLLNIGMGRQYFFSEYEIAEISRALALVSPDDIDGALDRLEAEFPDLENKNAREHMRRLIGIMRDEMANIADHKWALIAGMF